MPAAWLRAVSSRTSACGCGARSAALRLFVSLRLSSADDEPPPRAPDGLLDHVARRHETLRVLDLGNGRRALASAQERVDVLPHVGRSLRRCRSTRVGKWPTVCFPGAFSYNLQYMSVGGVRGRRCAHLMHLHTVVFWVFEQRRVHGALLQLEAKARTLLVTGPPALRRVTINSQRWEVRGRAPCLSAALDPKNVCFLTGALAYSADGRYGASCPRRGSATPPMAACGRRLGVPGRHSLCEIKQSPLGPICNLGGFRETASSCNDTPSRSCFDACTSSGWV